MNKFYSFIRGLVYLPAKMVFPTTIVGKHNMPLGRLITVTNHLQWSDILILAINVPGYRHIMAKKELGKNKLLRAVMNKAGVILIDRGTADLSAIRSTVNYLKKGEGLSLFPEGTRNHTDEDIKALKSGTVMFSVKGEAPIVPILIHSRSKVFRRNYMMIGEPFRLKEFEGKRLSPDILEQGAEIIGEKMKECKNLLDRAVEKGEIKKLIQIDKSYVHAQKMAQITAKKYCKKS